MYRAHPKDGIAWVTGASSGIGRTVALELSRRGYKVAATARRAAELESLAAESQNIYSFPGDITDRAGMARLAGEIEDLHGQIVLAFLNAGVYFITERDRFRPMSSGARSRSMSAGQSIVLIPCSRPWSGAGRVRSHSHPPWRLWRHRRISRLWFDKSSLDLYGRNLKAHL